MRKALALVILAALTAALSAQTAPVPQTPAAQSPQMLEAGKLFAAQDWPAAAKAYEDIVNAQPQNALAWYQLAMARFSQQQFREAIAAFEKNIALSNNPTAMYNAACAHARLGEKEQAVALLNKAVAAGLPPNLDMAADTDLAALQAEPAFRELVTSLDKKRRPCKYSTEAHQFDFWVGEWNVFNPQGRQAGTSVIQSVAEGCGILENWRDGFGGTGKSLNFYDPAAKKWFQYWMGAGGVPGRYSGTFSDGAMRFEAEPAVVNGQRTLGRLTFFDVDANTVRQLAEQSTDDGKSWKTLYDFEYVRKK